MPELWRPLGGEGPRTTTCRRAPGPAPRRARQGSSIQSLPRAHPELQGISMGLASPVLLYETLLGPRGSRVTARVASSRHSRNSRRTTGGLGVYPGVTSAVPSDAPEPGARGRRAPGTCTRRASCSFTGIRSRKRWEACLSERMNHFLKFHDLNKFENCGGYTR